MLEQFVKDVIGLPDSELRDRIRSNELARRELDAEMAALVAEAERRSLATRVDGHRSTIAFLRAELNCSTSDAAQWRSQGRAVAQLDGVGDAWASGRIGRGQVRRIAVARSPSSSTTPSIDSIPTARTMTATTRSNTGGPASPQWLVRCTSRRSAATV